MSGTRRGFRDKCDLPSCRGLNEDGTCPNGYGRSCESFTLRVQRIIEENREVLDRLAVDD